MASTDGDRSKFFPAIEKKHGEKVAFWLKHLKDLETDKYPEQIAYLKENYGFSQLPRRGLTARIVTSKNLNQQLQKR